MSRATQKQPIETAFFCFCLSLIGEAVIQQQICLRRGGDGSGRGVEGWQRVHPLKPMTGTNSTTQHLARPETDGPSVAPVNAGVEMPPTAITSENNLSQQKIRHHRYPCPRTYTCWSTDMSVCMYACMHTCTCAHIRVSQRDTRIPEGRYFL